MTLQEFFAAHPEAALAFSGGADSAYLLWAAVQYGRRVRAYYVQSPFQPAFELADARRLAKGLGADMRVLAVDVLALPEAAGNPPDRCYHCKHALFSAISAAAEADGFSLLIDGTNASDSAGDRPGMRALRELSVRSPLRECGLEKAEIRRLSREAGLFTWDKPAYACLATRIPAGTAITAEDLARAARGEAALLERGFSDFRLRLRDGGALLQVRREQMERARELLPELRELLAADFRAVELDGTPRQSRET